MSEDFARAFIETTKGWECDVVNDRNLPSSTFKYIESETDLVDDFLGRHTDIIDRRIDARKYALELVV